MIKFIWQNYNGRFGQTPSNLNPFSYSRWLTIFLRFLTLVFLLLRYRIISFLTWLSSPCSCFPLRLVMKDHVEREATRKSLKAAQQTSEAVSDVPASAELLAEFSHMSEPIRRTAQMIPTNCRIMINNKSFQRMDTKGGKRGRLGVLV